MGWLGLASVVDNLAFSVDEDLSNPTSQLGKIKIPIDWNLSDLGNVK
jgi:hypothetical protein